MEQLHWIPNYIFQEVDLFLFYIPILILIIGYQINKKIIWKKTLLILMLIIFLLYFFGAIASLSFPIQDYSLGLGSLLLLTLFPLTAIIYKIEQHKRNKKIIANTV
ncbi:MULTISPECIES: hypothetical protein [unclassified Nonlabens]|uniref:hypothetical protein n=1 Tax=unclassified Nonlabens TaxID=2615035 RepID=UPI0038705DA3